MEKLEEYSHLSQEELYKLGPEQRKLESFCELYKGVCCLYFPPTI